VLFKLRDIKVLVAARLTTNIRIFAKKKAGQVIQAPVLPYIFFAQLGLAEPEVYC